MRRDGHAYAITLDDGEEIVGGSVILALGARYRKLGVPGETELEGGNVYYAATEVEAQVCQGQDIAVVGGGNSAGQAALFLAERANKVYLLARCDDLGEDMSRYLIDRILAISNIEVLIQTCVSELVGEDELTGVTVEHKHTGERRAIDVTALFIFIGADAPTAWLADTLALDEKGFISTGLSVKTAPAWQDAIATHSCSRRACLGSSPWATSAAGPSGARPRRSAKDRWRCGSATRTWRRPEAPDWVCPGLLCAEHATRMQCHAVSS